MATMSPFLRAMGDVDNKENLFCNPMSTLLIYHKERGALSVPSHLVTPQVEKALHDTPNVGKMLWWGISEELPQCLRELSTVTRRVQGITPRGERAADVIIIQD